MPNQFRNTNNDGSVGSFAGKNQSIGQIKDVKDKKLKIKEINSEEHESNFIANVLEALHEESGGFILWGA